MEITKDGELVFAARLGGDHVDVFVEERFEPPLDMIKATIEEQGYAVFG